jgi:hypothetical protein
MAKEPFALRGFARGGSQGQGQGYRLSAQALAEEVQGRTPLLPTRPPHRHQHGLRPRPGPGPAATPDLPSRGLTSRRVSKTLFLKARQL